MVQVVLLALGSAAMTLVALMVRKVFGGTPPFLVAFVIWVVFVIIAGCVTVNAVFEASAARVEVAEVEAVTATPIPGESQASAQPPLRMAPLVTWDSAFQALAVCLLFFSVPVIISGLTVIQPVAAAGAGFMYGLRGLPGEGVEAEPAPEPTGEERRIAEAQFPAAKTLESFTFRLQPGLNEALVRELAQGAYITEYKNVIFLGESGSGKTHLAIALGMAACIQGRNVRFYTINGLLKEFMAHEADLTCDTVHRNLEQYHLLILDELGYSPIPKEGAQHLVDVVSRAHGRHSIILTTHVAPDAWSQVIGDDGAAKALAQVLTQNAYLVKTQGEHMRVPSAAAATPLEPENLA